MWASTSPAPKRSIIFNAVAAEEQGLLGSKYYGQHPSIPVGQIALAINFDSIPELGRVRDVTMLGVERTTFLPTVEKVASAMRLTIVPDQEPEQGYYYRSDHFSLAKVGVPAFSIEAGQDIIGKPTGWGKAQSADYREHRYHQPSDRLIPTGIGVRSVQMAQLWLLVGVGSRPGIHYADLAAWDESGPRARRVFARLPNDPTTLTCHAVRKGSVLTMPDGAASCVGRNPSILFSPPQARAIRLAIAYSSQERVPHAIPCQNSSCFASASIFASPNSWPMKRQARGWPLRRTHGAT